MNGAWRWRSWGRTGRRDPADNGEHKIVTQVINLETWTINSSFHFNSGKGLALWQGEIFIFPLNQGRSVRQQSTHNGSFYHHPVVA